MQVRRDNGVAIHIGLEPCVVVRKGGGEASVWERIGQPLSLVKIHILAEGNTDRRVSASAYTTRRGRRTWHVWKLVAREPGDPTSDQLQPSVLVCIGKARSHSRGRGKSDSAIVAEKAGCGAGGAKGRGQRECRPAPPVAMSITHGSQRRASSGASSGPVCDAYEGYNHLYLAGPPARTDPAGCLLGLMEGARSLSWPTPRRMRGARPATAPAKNSETQQAPYLS